MHVLSCRFCEIHNSSFPATFRATAAINLQQMDWFKYFLGLHPNVRKNHRPEHFRKLLEPDFSMC